MLNAVQVDQIGGGGDARDEFYWGTASNTHPYEWGCRFLTPTNVARCGRMILDSKRQWKNALHGKNEVTVETSHSIKQVLQIKYLISAIIYEKIHIDLMWASVHILFYQCLFKYIYVSEDCLMLLTMEQTKLHLEYSGINPCNN